MHSTRYVPLCLLLLVFALATLMLPIRTDAIALPHLPRAKQLLSPAVRKRRRPKTPKFGDGGSEEDETDQQENGDGGGVDEAAQDGVQDGVQDAVEDKARETANDALSCFPADALVKLESGDEVPMVHLPLGASVQVSVDGKFSNVFMFTHKRPVGLYPFVSITTSNGKTIALSPSHYIYANQLLKPAADVAKGDVLQVYDGNTKSAGTAVVMSVKSIFAQGLYNPQTLHGDIVVNGVRASTYTSAVHPSFAHYVALAPFRALWKWTGLDFSFGILHDDKLTSATAWMLPRATGVLRPDTVLSN